jgi:hypothetical protein
LVADVAGDLGADFVGDLLVGGLVGDSAADLVGDPADFVGGDAGACFVGEADVLRRALLLLAEALREREELPMVRVVEASRGALASGVVAVGIASGERSGGGVNLPSTSMHPKRLLLRVLASLNSYQEGGFD